MDTPLKPEIYVDFKTPSGWHYYIEGTADWSWAENEWPVSMNPETDVIKYETEKYPQIQSISVTLAETFKGNGPAHKIKPWKQLDDLIGQYWAEFEAAFKAQAVDRILRYFEP